MKKILSFLFLTGILLPFSLTARYNKAARRGTAKAASELSSMAREVRVSRQIRSLSAAAAAILAISYGVLTARRSSSSSSTSTNSARRNGFFNSRNFAVVIDPS